MSSAYILRHILLDGIPPIMDGILPLLMACEVASLLCALGIESKFRHRKKYLNPLRDLDPTMKFLGPMLDSGHTVLMLGERTDKIIQRITNPMEYWSSERWKTEYDPGTWVVAIPRNAPEVLDKAGAQVIAHDMNTSGAWWNFRDLIVRNLLKQIWVEDNDIGYMGEEPDWSFVWQCTSHEGIDSDKGTHVSLLTLIPEPWCDYRPHTITMNGVEFYADWAAAYMCSIRDGRRDKFPYIHVSDDPLKIMYTTSPPSPAHMSDVHMTLHGEDGTKSYIPIF